jgi:hypothetical protein
MRRSLSLVLSILIVGVVSAALVAQTHDNNTEKKASDTIRLSADVMVGTQLLKAGEYDVSCDRATIKFFRVKYGPGTNRTRTEVLAVACQGRQIDPVKETSLLMPAGKDGVRVLEKLLLKGSNVEHVFPR